MNFAAIDAGVNGVHKVEVPTSWADAEGDITKTVAIGRDQHHTNYINNVLKPTNGMYGDEIPVSVFKDYSDGHIPSGTAAFEKERNLLSTSLSGMPIKCMRCNWCSYVLSSCGNQTVCAGR